MIFRIYRFPIGIGIFVAAFVVGCVLVPQFPINPANERREIVSAEATTHGETSDEQEITTEDEFIEVFADDSKIGRKGKNKVEILCFDRGKDRVAEIRFYTLRSDDSWEKRQSFEFVKASAPPCDPEIRDLNNDGFNDFTYWSDSAARGSNELRTLFVYNKKTDKLVHIINSNEYPNLEFNPRSNSLTAWQFHGATTTVFLRIDGNKLNEFASVGTGSQLVARVIANDGSERVVWREDMPEDDIYTRYQTFDPPKPLK